MAYENFWPQVQTNLSTTGGSDGRLSVTSTYGFYVRQKVTLSSGSSNTTGAIKEIISSTVVRVGADDGNYPGIAYNLSGYAPAGTLFAGFQQIVYGRVTDVLKSAYDGEPVKAIRTVTVDPIGNYIDVSGSSVPASFQYIKVAAATVTASNTTSASAYSVGSISSSAKVFTVLSSLDNAIGISLNGIQVSELNQGESFGYDLGGNGRVINAGTTIGIWNIGSVSSTGSIRFQVVS